MEPAGGGGGMPKRPGGKERSRNIHGRGSTWDKGIKGSKLLMDISDALMINTAHFW